MVSLILIYLLITSSLLHIATYLKVNISIKLELGYYWNWSQNQLNKQNPDSVQYIGHCFR